MTARRWLAVLGVLAAAQSAVADEVVELSHRGATLVGVPADPAARYDVAVWPARRGAEALRVGLDLLLARSPSSAAGLERLKRHGPVVLVYDPAFPPEDASSIGARLGAFIPELVPAGADAGAAKAFPMVVGRYGIKWGPEEIALTIAHELLGHGTQHLRGDLEAMSERDKECEAGLYEEIARQHLGVDKRSEVTVRFRQDLEWRWCVPFKQYLAARAPQAMAHWQALHIDAPALLARFEAYLRAASGE